MKNSDQFGEGKARILKGETIRIDDHRVEVGADPGEEELPTDPGEPEESSAGSDVNTMKDDDGRIRAIDVTCCCGRRIHLTCEYMEAGNAAESA
jgi:hypothetical protein